VRRYLSYRHKKYSKIEWKKAPDIKRTVKYLIKNLDMKHINPSRIFCYRSFGAKTSASARIWGLPKIWQMTLIKKPSYIIEVISERYDGLADDSKFEILLHELAHIPNNFSGSLVPHYRKGKRNFRNKVKELVVQYKKKSA